MVNKMCSTERIRIEKDEDYGSIGSIGSIGSFRSIGSVGSSATKITDIISLDGFFISMDKRTGKSTISNFTAFLHFMKAHIGLGFLALPHAFRNAGLVGGILGYGCICLICTYCMIMLVRASHKALKTRPSIECLDYAMTANAAFCDAGGLWEKYAVGTRRMINIMICICQVSYNSAYVLFISENIRPVLIYYGGITMQHLEHRYYILMLLPFMLLLCCVRDLRYMSPCSLVANVLQTAGIGILFYLLVHNGITISSSAHYFGNVNRLPLFFGTVMFANSGSLYVLTIENKMQHPENMLGLDGLLSKSTIIQIFLNVSMGFFGYFKYGENVGATITTNLQPGEYTSLVALCILSVAIFFTYLVYFYVLIEIIKKDVLEARLNGIWLELADYMTRIAINIFIFALAVTVPYLDHVISFIGAVNESILCIIVPALIDTASNWNDLGKYNWKAVKNGVIIMIGLFGLVIGTFFITHNIIQCLLFGHH